MRAALAAIATLIPLTAVAGPLPGGGTFRDVVVQPPRHETGKTQFTQVSHLIYLNNCLPNGCTVNPGFDDALSQHSSIPQTQSHLAAWSWGTDSWNQLVQCVKDMYAPFQVQITDVDPGPSTPHFELMVGGNSSDIGVQGALGVAPFIPCNGNLENNIITFVFSAETSSTDYLCWAAAQETAHAFGLDHEMNADDPMTYLSPPIKKAGFQNAATPCGEYQDRQCWCGQGSQNSYQYLIDTFGPTNPVPPTMAITSPADGEWLEPGFHVRATATSQLSIMATALQIDGQPPQAGASEAPLVYDTPADLAGGDHTITVSATDVGGNTFSTAVHVHVVAACASGGHCDGDFKCLGGYCLPDSTTPGGLGATCTDASVCITGSCGTDGTDHLCTAACDSGGKCPSGFACTSAEGAAGGVCWPAAPSSGGGCSTNGGGAPLAALGSLVALFAFVRRRR